MDQSRFFGMIYSLIRLFKTSIATGPATAPPLSPFSITTETAYLGLGIGPKAIIIE
jgi:hypothetical protein